MSVLIHDDMIELTREELNMFQGLTEEQQTAYKIVRNTSECASKRLKLAETLPDEVLLKIGNVVAMTIYHSRRA